MNQQKLQKILMIASAAVIAIIIMTTIITCGIKKGHIGDQWRSSDPTPQQIKDKSRNSKQKLGTFDLMGQMRIQVQDDDENSKGAILVISPWFSFPEEDSALYEEMSQKSKQFRGIITSYFSSRTKSQLLRHGEKSIKQDLKQQLNQELVLGKIQDIYFTDYNFLE